MAWVIERDVILFIRPHDRGRHTGDRDKENCSSDHKASLTCRYDGQIAAAAHQVFSLEYFDKD